MRAAENLGGKMIKLLQSAAQDSATKLTLLFVQHAYNQARNIGTSRLSN